MYQQVTRVGSLTILRPEKTSIHIWIQANTYGCLSGFVIRLYSNERLYLNATDRLQITGMKRIVVLH
jgi:hypothetical protein